MTPTYEYFINPDYGDSCASRGGSGTSMEVTLGPGAVASTNYGSKTGATSIPRCMEPLNAKDYTILISGLQAGTARGLWVAGHLLNDNLGGLGTQDTNLTPLTGTANKNHATYEGYIKKMLVAADQIHRSKRVSGKYTFGVWYKVEVIDHFGSFKPYSFAPSSILISCKLKKWMTGTSSIVDATQADIDACSKDHQAVFKKVFTAVTIDNDDDHLSECVNGDCMHA